MSFKFTRFLSKLERDSRIILINRSNGKSIKMTAECYDILVDVVGGPKMVKNDLLKAFEEEEDRDYFDKLIQMLEEREIIVSSDKIEKVILNDIALDITNRCNLQCIHCMASATTYEDEKELSTVQLIEVIDKIINANPEGITISGGEPMIREDFYDVCKYIKDKYNGKLELMTNAVLIDEGNVNQLVEWFDSFSISLDGADEESVALIRGSGVFERVINAIKLIKKMWM